MAATARRGRAPPPRARQRRRPRRTDTAGRREIITRCPRSSRSTYAREAVACFGSYFDTSCPIVAGFALRKEVIYGEAKETQGEPDRTGFRLRLTCLRHLGPAGERAPLG